MPRGYIGAINKTDAKEAFKAGAYAIEMAEKGGASIAIKYEGGKTVLKAVPLGNVAAKTRHMPDNFLTKDGTSWPRPASPISTG